MRSTRLHLQSHALPNLAETFMRHARVYRLYISPPMLPRTGLTPNKKRHMSWLSYPLPISILNRTFHDCRKSASVHVHKNLIPRPPMVCANRVPAPKEEGHKSTPQQIQSQSRQNHHPGLAYGTISEWASQIHQFFIMRVGWVFGWKISQQKISISWLSKIFWHSQENPINPISRIRWRREVHFMSNPSIKDIFPNATMGYIPPKNSLRPKVLISSFSIIPKLGLFIP